MTIRATCVPSFKDLAEMIVSFVSPGSRLYGIKIVQLVYDGMFLHITSKDANMEHLMKKYDEHIALKARRYV